MAYTHRYFFYLIEASFTKTLTRGRISVHLERWVHIPHVRLQQPLRPWGPVPRPGRGLRRVDGQRLWTEEESTQDLIWVWQHWGRRHGLQDSLHWGVHGQGEVGGDEVPLSVDRVLVQCSLKHFLLCFAAGAVNVLMVPQVGGNGVGKVAGTLIQANCSFVSREKC